jgi:dolichol-phosphate mannosyltransferase
VANIDISIVIPARDEAGNIGGVLDEIAGAMARVEGLAYEIIVIDDGSTDGTRAEVKAAMARIAALRLIVHGRGSGKSAALKTGFDASRGRFVATLDGDGQNDPADLAAMWPLVRDAGPGVMFAGRRRGRNDGVVKMLTSRFANAVRRRLLRDDCKDTGCGFKVMPGEFARGLPYFDNMHRFFPALGRRAGLAVREEWINDRARKHGKSKYGFFDRAAVAFLDTVGVYWLIRRFSVRGEIVEEKR